MSDIQEVSLDDLLEDEQNIPQQTATVNPHQEDIPEETTEELTLDDVVEVSAEELENEEEFPTVIQQADAQNQPTFDARFQPTEDGTDPEEFLNDEDFLIAASNIYKFNHNQGRSNKPAINLKTGKALTNQELVDYALDAMGWFNYYMPTMAIDAAVMSRADYDTKASFLYLMEAYDDKNITWDGFFRFAKAAPVDPTNWAGLSAFGWGLIGSQTAKITTKAGVKEFLKNGMRNALIAGTEGAIYSSADNYMRQVIETSVTGEEIDRKEQLGAAVQGFGLGASFGFALTPAISTVQKIVTKKLGKSKTKPTAKKETVGEADISEKDLVDASNNLAQRAAVEGTSTAPSAIVSSLQKVQSVLKNTVSRGVVGVDPKTGVQNRADVKEATSVLTKIIGDVLPKDKDAVVHAMSRMFNTLNPAEVNALGVSIQNNVGQLKKKLTELNAQSKAEGIDADTKAAIDAEYDEIDNLTIQLEKLDSMFRTHNARNLGLRQDYLNRGELLDVTPSSIAKEKNLSEQEARDLFDDIVDKMEARLQRDNDIKKLSGKINTAIKRGQVGKAYGLVAERKSLLKQKAYDEANSKSGYYFNRTIEALNEYIIGTVFTPSTQVYNTIPSAMKTFYKPLLNFAVEGEYGRIGFAKLLGTYTAMGKMTRGAARSAIQAYRYEKSMLTGDYSKFLENHNVMPKRIKGIVPVGSVIRFFPNLLNMTDEFFTQLNYRGYMEGNAIANALLKDQADLASGKIKKPRKGQKLKDFVQKEVDSVLNNAYENIDEAVIKQQMLEQALTRGYNYKRAVKFVRDEMRKVTSLRKTIEGEAKEKGLEGKNLVEYVNNEMGKRSIYSKATNKEATDYTEDLLFKRRFSDDGGASSLAAGYEGWVNRMPILRTLGQLFVRTPIRVFEEGIRLTPGVQLIAPKYMQDLIGNNGKARQIRAQGEALMSYAIAGYVFQKYAEGTVTSASNADYRKRKAREDNDRSEPYSILLDDGDTFNFNRYDPISTPLKIIVNALENAEALEYRKRKGEYSEDDYTILSKKNLDTIYIGVGALFNAIKDASLMEGLDQITNLGSDLLANEDAWWQNVLKFMGQKSQLLFPNVIFKTKNVVNEYFFDEPTTMKKPRTALQYLEARADLGLTSVAKQYDALGNVRTVPNPAASLLGVSVTTPEQRKKGKSEQDLFVLREIELIGIATDSYIDLSHKVPKYFGTIDLAATTKHPVTGEPLLHPVTQEPITLYDRYAELYRTLDGGISNKLYPILKYRRGKGLGTSKHDGYITTAVRGLISEQKDRAGFELLRELGMLNKIAKDEVRKGRSKAGLNDDNIFPNVRN